MNALFRLPTELIFSVFFLIVSRHFLSFFNARYCMRRLTLYRVCQGFNHELIMLLLEQLSSRLTSVNDWIQQRNKRCPNGIFGHQFEALKVYSPVWRTKTYVQGDRVVDWNRRPNKATMSAIYSFTFVQDRTE